MKNAFFSVLIVPTLYPTCNFKAYQLDHLFSDRRSYQQIVDDSLVVNLRAKRDYDEALVQQVSLCYQQMELQQLKACDFAKLIANPETDDYDGMLIQRDWLGQNYVYQNWSIDTRKYDASILPQRALYYKRFWGWMDSCFSPKNLQGIDHRSARELYAIIADSQTQFKLREVKYIPLKKDQSIGPDYAQLTSHVSRDGSIRRVEIHYNKTKLTSVHGTGDYEHQSATEIE